MKRGAGEQEKESAKEEKVEEVHTSDMNDTTSPQKPADNERIIAPTTFPRRTHVAQACRHIVYR